MGGARISSGAKLKRIDKEEFARGGGKYKRPRLELSRKVCAMLVCESDDGHSELRMYVVDLNDGCGNEFVYRPPTLRLNYYVHLQDAFCVMGSTLFVFEGCALGNRPVKKSIFTFDLGSVSETSDIRLEKHRLTYVGEMLEGKRYAKATPTPDGKILVFSSTLNHTALPYACPRRCNGYPKPLVKDEVVANVVDFELYDPATNVSVKLPRICHNWADCVKGYSFDRESTFYLRTEEGSFSLPLGKEGVPERWDRCPCVPIPHGGSVLIDEDICLLAQGCYDNSIAHEEALPGFSPVPRNLRPQGYRFALLGGVEDGGGCDFCVVQPCLSRRTDKPHLIVDVCAFDVDRYYRDVKRAKRHGGERGIRFKKTLRYVVGKVSLDSICCIGLFTM